MKLKYQNNWEQDIYTTGHENKIVSDIELVRIDDVEYVVSSRFVDVTYYDMGHDYNARSKHYFIKTKVFGIIMEFDLNKIVPRKDVTLLKYTVEN